MTMFNPDTPGIDVFTLPRPHILRGGEQRSPRPLEPDAGEAYRDHLEEALTTLQDRERQLVKELVRLAGRFGVTLPGWVGAAPRPLKRVQSRSRTDTLQTTSAALLKRRGVTLGPVAGLAMDAATSRVLLNGQTLKVTPIERLLLAHLLERPGQLCSRAELIWAGWKYKHATTADVHRLNVAMCRMRNYLTAAGWTGAIVTEPNLGYVLEAPV